MTIVVQCPHCETKFNLPPEMMGKTIRCPNVQCREVFPVKEQALPVEPPPLPPEPLPDEPEAVEPRRKKKAEKPKRPKTGPAVVEGEVVEAAVVAAPKVKEVVWTEGAGAPTPPAGDSKAGKPRTKGKRANKRDKPDRDFIPIRRRKKRKHLAPLILIGMLTLTVLIGMGASFYLLHMQDVNEQRDWDKAKKEYQQGDYAKAGDAFKELAKNYPEGQHAEEYQFMASLCDMEVTVRAVTVKDEPEPALKKFKEFIGGQEKSDFAKPAEGKYGKAIYEAGKKLGDDITSNVGDRIQAFRGDRSAKAGELPKAEKSIGMGRELIKLIERFRGDELPPNEIRQKLDQAEAEIKKEHDRSAAIAKAAATLNPLSDAAIQVAEADLAASGFLEDAESQHLLADARGRLRDMVKFEADPATPVQMPSAITGSLLFVTPIGKTAVPPASTGAGSVFLAVARGVLYAIDERGNMLWAVRVGEEVSDPPTVAQVETDNGILDLALVTSNVNGKPALSAHVLRTGQPLWYQPLAVHSAEGKPDLSVPAAGPVVVVGTRGYVAVRDALGSIYEYDLPSGVRKGRIRLGQPVGPGLVLRPGTGLIYAAADARRIFTIDVGVKDEDGNLKPPQCVQVIATGHPPGAIRIPPLLIGQDGDQPADRWMLLSQSEGPMGMKIRAYVVPPIQPPAPDAKPPAETPATPSAELPVKGWTWFPPATDGERLALVSDAGQVRLFEVKQAGTADKPIFALPEPKVSTTAVDASPVRGVAFAGEEASFWVLSSGVLQKYRLGLIPSRGIEMLAVGPKIPLGEATQAPQYTAHKDAACLVVRSQTSDGCKAVLLNLRDGSFRWQRQLGLVPAADPIAQGDGLLVVARDGGVVSVPSSLGSVPGTGLAAPANWVVAPPPEGATSPTAVAASADGKTMFTVTQVFLNDDLKPTYKFLIRRLVGGRIAHEGTANAPLLSTGAPTWLSGPPVVLGNLLLMPLNDGLVYRHAEGMGSGRQSVDKLDPGPTWSGGQKVEPNTRCYLTPLTPESFLTTDGTKKITRWEWLDSGSNRAGEWELRDQPTGPGLLLPPAVAGRPHQLMMADMSGAVTLFANDQGGKMVRRWRPQSGGKSLGKPTSHLVMQMDAMGKPVVAYTVEDKTVVCIDPTREAPLWLKPVRAGDDVDGTLVGAPVPLGAGRWAATDLGGRVTVIDTASGSLSGAAAVGLPGAVPAAASLPLGKETVLTSLSDGSAAVMRLQPSATAAPEAAEKE